MKKYLYIYWEYYDRGKTDDETAVDLKEFVESKELIKADAAEPKTIHYFGSADFKWSLRISSKGHVCNIQRKSNDLRKSFVLMLALIPSMNFNH